jgi:hypothetical protein
MSDDESHLSSLLSQDWNSSAAWGGDGGASSDDDDDDSVDADDHDKNDTYIHNVAHDLFVQKWDKLEKELTARQAHLDIIAVGKNPALIRQIRDRELQAAMHKREQLLLEQLAAVVEGNKSSTVVVHASDTNPKNGRSKRIHADTITATSSSSVQHCQMSSSSPPPARSLQLWQRMYDAMVFEVYSTGRATFALALHCMALAGIVELVGEMVRCFLGVVRQRFAFTSEWIDIALYIFVFAVGVALVRWTGYLYWWLGDQEYDCLKFDYHNRIRLGYSNARIMWAVRQSPVLRFWLFMVGYYLVYTTSHALMSYVYRWCGQQARLNQFLPSATFLRHEFQTLSAAEREIDLSLQFVCSRTCQQEMDRQSAAHSELHRIERDYTLRVLSKDSYYVYWSQWALSWGTADYGVDETVPLFNNTGEILFALGVFVTCKFLGLRMAAMVPA